MNSGAARGDSAVRIDPSDTLARILPLAPAMGITRIADLTGLDIVGVPVAAAIRPNSRSLAVHQGKGLSRSQAKVSAIMEAAEAFHAENIQAVLRLARPNELGFPCVDVMRVPRLHADSNSLNESRFLWIEGRDLITGGGRFVPYETVHCDFTAAQPEGSFLFPATSNGMGAGNDQDEAIVHALCEVIERDAVAVWRETHVAAGAAQAIDLATIDDADCVHILSSFAAARTDVAIWEVTSDIGIAVFLCLAVPHDRNSTGVEAEFGAGCHPSAATALRRALIEAAQSRVTRISGARDDFDPKSYDPAARTSRHEEAQRWLAAAARPPLRDFRSTPRRESLSRRESLDALLKGLVRVGCGQVVWVDLSQPTLGIPVGRVVVPGLEAPWTGHGRAVRLGRSKGSTR